MKMLKFLQNFILLVFIISIKLNECQGYGFIYDDFNHTDGLVFNGAASTSSCEEKQSEKHQPGYGYQDRHGKQVDEVVLESLEESVEKFQKRTIETDQAKEIDILNRENAGFGHRDDKFFTSYKASQEDTCPVRVKLTPSKPFQTGSIFRGEKANALKGFSTKFSFQVTDLSKVCTLVRDASFSVKKYKTCAVHGADGFAFVLHGDQSGYNALGNGGKQLGFGGLSNTIAVEFDLWYNPEIGDTLEDHITVLSNGKDTIDVDDTNVYLSFPQTHPLGDGLVHTAKITYFPFIKTDFFQYFRSTNVAKKYYKDNGEDYRMGTLVVWVDDMNIPKIAFPINLSVLLEVDQVHVGFTGATGESWASQDILKWVYCETHDDEACL